MLNTPLLILQPPFDRLADEGRWGEYLSSFSERGISWWFDMKIPEIAFHLARLHGQPLPSPDSTRLRFLRASIGPILPTEEMGALYQAFLEEKDFDGAAAAAGAGTAAVWDSGADFGRFDEWVARIDQLLERKEGISALCRSSLYGFRGLAELMGRGNLSRAETYWTAQREWAEKAGSRSLRIYGAAAASYPLTWSGRIEEARILLDDAEPLASLPETSLVCGTWFRIALGSCHIASGDASGARRVLEEVVEHPLFGILPPSIWLLGQSHFLMAAAFEGDETTAEAVSKRIHAHAVPEGNHFHHGYSHFNLGITAVRLRQPGRALLHVRESIERGRKSGSPVPETVSALVLGQALAELNRIDEALEHLEKWIVKWEAAGFVLFASAGLLEISALNAKKGRNDEARRCFEKAGRLLPSGEPPPGLFRPPEFAEAIRVSLYPPAGGVAVSCDPETAPVWIETFGGLKVRVGRKLLYDRQWRGKRTKMLLKALVAFGGAKVSSDLLVDTIWPDLDGDRGHDNLKVSVSRLRRLGTDPGETPPGWVLVRHGKVSLARLLCAADAILFEEGIRASRNGDAGIGRLADTLRLYKGDFLPNDVSEGWVVRHRERLREEFIRGAIDLSGMCIDAGRHEEPIPFLRKALDQDPLHEEIYGALMRVHLALGYPSRAILLYRQAEETLERELGIAPGASLRALKKEAGGET